MKLKKVKLADLVLDNKNSVTHSTRNIDAVKNSIRKFGQWRAFVVQKSSNKVIIGNGMLEAMLDMGMTEGDVYFVDVDDKKAELMGAVDNKTGEMSDWNHINLKEIIKAQDQEDLIDLGWENHELDALLGIENDAPDFTGIDIEDEDFDIDADGQKKKKNTGRVTFKEGDWVHIRKAIMAVRDEFPETTESEAIAIACKRYAEAYEEDE